MSQLPPIKWAQRAGSLYITIDVADIKNQNIVLDETHLTFRCVQGRVSEAKHLVLLLPPPQREWRVSCHTLTRGTLCCPLITRAQW